MTTMASQITSLTVVYSIVYKKTSKLRVTGLCAGNSPGPVNSPHKGPVTRKMSWVGQTAGCIKQGLPSRLFKLSDRLLEPKYVLILTRVSSFQYIRNLIPIIEENWWWQINSDNAVSLNSDNAGSLGLYGSLYKSCLDLRIYWQAQINMGTFGVEWKFHVMDPYFGGTCSNQYKPRDFICGWVCGNIPVAPFTNMV